MDGNSAETLLLHLMIGASYLHKIAYNLFFTSNSLSIVVL